MRESEKLSQEQIRAFLQASEEIHFEGKQRPQMYEWVTAILQQHRYRQQSREGKGLLRGSLSKMTGLSRAQMTRLIGQYRDPGEGKEASYRRHRFTSKYTRADVELLATVEEAQENLNGAATRKILEREWKE